MRKNFVNRIVSVATQDNKRVELVRENYDNHEFMYRTRYYTDDQVVDQTCYFHVDYDEFTYDELVKHNKYMVNRKLNRFVENGTK